MSLKRPAGILAVLLVCALPACTGGKDEAKPPRSNEVGTGILDKTTLPPGSTSTAPPTTSGPTTTAPNVTSVRLLVQRPTPTGWANVACGETVSGVGNLRVQGYVTAPGSVRTRFDFGAGTQFETWYVTTNQRGIGGVETRLIDVVQDLDRSAAAQNFGWQVVGSTAIAKCTVTATAIPAASEGNKSDRTAPANPVQVAGAVTSYKTGETIPCGGSAPNGVAGRVIFTLSVTDDAPGLADLHAHAEIAGFIGPDQNGNGSDFRFWEAGLFGVETTAGISSPVAIVNPGPIGTVTFHAGQQAATAEAPTRIFPESFCTVRNSG